MIPDYWVPLGSSNLESVFCRLCYYVINLIYKMSRDDSFDVINRIWSCRVSCKESEIKSHLLSNLL